MLNLLEYITGFFSGKQTAHLQTDSGYSVDEAVERVIEGIDVKLRIVSMLTAKLLPVILKFVLTLPRLMSFSILLAAAVN